MDISTTFHHVTRKEVLFKRAMYNVILFSAVQYSNILTGIKAQYLRFYDVHRYEIQILNVGKAFVPNSSHCDSNNAKPTKLTAKIAHSVNIDHFSKS